MQGLTKCKCSAGEDDETCDKFEYHKTVGSKAVILTVWYHESEYLHFIILSFAVVAMY